MNLRQIHTKNNNGFNQIYSKLGIGIRQATVSGRVL